jgi:putative transposase
MISAPDRRTILLLIHEAHDHGARYAPACKIVGISLRTFQRWNQEGMTTQDKRPIAPRKPPKNKMSADEEQDILDICVQPEYVDKTPPYIVPHLADRGRYIASESSFYRVHRKNKLDTKRTFTKTHNNQTITTHIALGPNQVWSWDISWLPGEILGFFFKLYLILDIFSRYIIQWEIHVEESQKHAKELVTKAVVKHHLKGTPLVIHSDNGSPMKAQSFQVLLTKLGITKSYSRPRVSNDNPYSEAMFKTVKYVPSFPSKGFASIEEARTWMHGFVQWYNTKHLHSGIRYVTPHQRHYGEDQQILAKRKEVYEKAREKHPERWTGNIRNWDYIPQVALNPVKEKEINENDKRRQLS